ncbi:ABC-F family ATP-binding cassette domain-containing protein [Phytobacter sp. V91]|uniref:ABC-F family ATP-binding cassette domain-containing protein n=1 Tax=Phytobacter sp. V91 TaxID=3369425 RepID=UPI003F6147A2
MSTLLSAQSLRVETAFGPLFSDISFTLKQGDRLGLIGDNGCGKSTLLKVLDGTLAPINGTVSVASHCLLARVEQHLPDALRPLTLLDAVLAQLPLEAREAQRWRAESLLAGMGLSASEINLPAATLSGGQHTRLLLARALINEPDLLLLDEPSNHLDLPTLLWLEQFLQRWQGSFVLVSHDKVLLDAVTNGSWILRDQQLHCFSLPCSAARQALSERDSSDALRRKAEQKEIDRVTTSAKRLATWGRVYDNEDLARKAKQMEKQVERLKESQTQLTAGSQWRLALQGEPLVADRLLALENLAVCAAPELPALFRVALARIKTGDRVAIIGQNGCGKSSLLRLIWRHLSSADGVPEIQLHPRLHSGYYDQSLEQLPDNATLLDALTPFAPSAELRKKTLISAGFSWSRHGQKVATLSGGERSRLLFVGLSLARYNLVLLDEPTNHLDMAGKETLAQTLGQFSGGVLLVSHDRELIRASCNRFWLIHDGQFSEWHDVDAACAVLGEKSSLAGDMSSSPQISAIAGEDENDALLERLIELEALLEQDLARKVAHQKPARQAQWREEIKRISAILL